MYTILLVEDEPGMRTIICDYFAAQTDAPAVVCAEDGHAALALVAAQDFDLALLDIMLPEADGFAVCRAIRRKSDMPVIFLTARRAEEDKLQGYGLGADDYMEKPFSLPVLYVKVQALLRRAKGYVCDAALHAPGVTLNLRTGLVAVDGREIDLPPKEFALLRLLMENPGGLLPRETLLTRVWGWDYDGSDRVVDNRIKNLRRALGPHAACIRTIFKTGYRWEAERHEN